MVDDGIWLPVVGYEGLYEVSEWGAVKSLEKVCAIGSRKITKPSVVLQPMIRSGYKMVQLYKDGTKVHHLVHRLVAKAYLRQVSGKDMVNHIDGNKLNNWPENLEWCTRNENMKHAAKMGLLTGPKKKAA